MPQAEFEVPTWNQIYEMLLRQAERISESCFKPDVIVGIARGGWLTARVLSDLLETPNLANVSAEYYVDIAETRNSPVLTQGVSVAVKGKKVLIADDVADTGRSLKLVKEHVLQRGAKEVKTATLYYKPWSIIKPDYYAKETKLWIVFPWEIKETVRKIVEKHREEGLSVEEETAKLVKAGLPKRLTEKLLNEMFEERKC
jgi:hypoxanthine phosphoribosyltransferase